MRLRHILEYDDSDIRDLLGDLDSIGQTKNYVGTLWARFHTYRLLDDYWSKSPEYMCFLKTEPFYGTGDEDRDNAIMLQKIQSGNFFRPNDPDARSWASLKKGNPMVVDFLEKRKVQSLAKTCSTMDELVDQIRENLVRAQQYALQGQLDKVRHIYSEETASTVLVYGFLAPEGSPYLVTANLDEPILKGSSINYIK
jgi:hypothetical protein